MSDVARKNDSTKPRFDLLPWDACELQFGGPNWSFADLVDELRRWWVNREFAAPTLALDYADVHGVVAVLEFGARKYSAHQWELGFTWSRVFAAAMRHAAAVARDPESRDPESGLLHRYHYLCGHLFLATFAVRNVGKDDRRIL